MLATVRSAGEDSLRGAIDRLAGSLLVAIGKWTGSRKLAATGRAARSRGGARTIKGRLKRWVH